MFLYQHYLSSDGVLLIRRWNSSTHPKKYKKRATWATSKQQQSEQQTTVVSQPWFMSVTLFFIIIISYCSLFHSFVLVVVLYTFLCNIFNDKQFYLLPLPSFALFSPLFNQYLLQILSHLNYVIGGGGKDSKDRCWLKDIQFNSFFLIMIYLLLTLIIERIFMSKGP